MVMEGPLSAARIEKCRFDRSYVTRPEEGVMKSRRGLRYGGATGLLASLPADGGDGLG